MLPTYDGAGMEYREEILDQSKSKNQWGNPRLSDAQEFIRRLFRPSFVVLQQYTSVTWATSVFFSEPSLAGKQCGKIIMESGYSFLKE